MSCKCRICRNNLQQTVLTWHQDGLKLSEISERLQRNHKLSVSTTVLQRHFESFGVKVDAVVDAVVKVVKPKSENPTGLAFDLNSINFDRYDFDSENALEVIAYLQKCLLYLTLEQIEIACAEQQLYKRGMSESSPHSSFLRLKMLFEMLDTYTGLSIYANQQAAIKKVEMMGLKIERFSILASEEENVRD